MSPLRTLCSIESGYSFRGSVGDDPAGDCRVVQLGDVDWDAEQIRWEDLPRVSGIDPDRRLRSGDILFAAKGRTFRALCLGARQEPERPAAVAASTFYVVRPKRDDVLAAYVAWYLNTAPAQHHLTACSAGTNIPRISKQCLGSVPLPLPPVETQQRIAALQRLGREERALVGMLTDLRSGYLEAACIQLAHLH